LYTLRKRKRLLGVLFLLQAYFGLEFYPSLLQTVGRQLSVLYIKEFVLFSVGPQVKIVPVLDAFRVLTLFSGTLTHLEAKLFFSVIFCSITLLLLNIYCIRYECMCIYEYSIYIYIYFFSHRIMTGCFGTY
jgi:hypothetical protein